MTWLVNFIAIENVVDIASNSDYVHRIYNELCSRDLIKKLVINASPENVPSNSSPEIVLDEFGNSFAIDFIAEENDKQDTMRILFEFKTFRNNRQLEILIESDNYQIDIENEYLEKLKLRIKNFIVRDWKKIIWLTDRDSECISMELYPQIYRIENKFRELINQVMNRQFGTAWWDSIAPYEMKEKHRARLEEYKAKVPSFSNVDDRLMSIDVGDLIKLITIKRYKWVPKFNEEINALINGIQKCNSIKVIELLENQRIVDVNLWEEQFSKLLPEDFVDSFKIFARDRNHVMHNKLIDRDAAKQISKNVIKIEKDLNKAFINLRAVSLSDEEIKKVEIQRLTEFRILEGLDHYCKENDTNISIRLEYEIIELLEDSIIAICESIKEQLRFRNDIDIYINRSLNNTSGLLMEARSIVDYTELKFYYTMDINDEEGAISSLKIECETMKDKLIETIEYTNGKVEFDSENNIYMASIEDQLDEGSVAERVFDFIDCNIINYKDKLVDSDFAEGVECTNCGESYVCINETSLPIGTCVNCGHVNQLEICEICGEWFNPEASSNRFVEDGHCVCDNCGEHLEELHFQKRTK